MWPASEWPAATEVQWRAAAGAEADEAWEEDADVEEEAEKEEWSDAHARSVEEVAPAAVPAAVPTVDEALLVAEPRVNRFMPPRKALASRAPTNGRASHAFRGDEGKPSPPAAASAGTLAAPTPYHNQHDELASTLRGGAVRWSSEQLQATHDGLFCRGSFQK